MADLSNKTLGNFRISYSLGSGGMGTVYKARDTMLDIPVAIKVMHAQFSQKKEFQERFQREARSAASVRHRNIVGVRHFEEEDGYLYMVMDYVDGGNLRERLNKLSRQNEWIPLREALKLVKTVCHAIGAVHDNKVIHRDIKPANIMLQPDEQSEFGYRPVITDLGLAKIVGVAGITQTAEVMGTPAYMSPEQVLEPLKNVGAATDIYAVGVLLYELVTRQPPFVTNSVSEITRYHLKEPVEYPDLETLHPELPAGINPIVRKALMRDPADRYTSAREMAFAIGQLLRQEVAPQEVADVDSDSSCEVADSEGVASNDVDNYSVDSDSVDNDGVDNDGVDNDGVSELVYGITVYPESGVEQPEESQLEESQLLLQEDELPQEGSVVDEDELAQEDFAVEEDEFVEDVESHVQERIRVLPPGGGVTFMDLDTMPITVGREEDNVLMLRDDPKLSRYHAQIEYEDDVFYLTDKNSTNGVYFDDQLVQPNTRIEWPRGTTIRIGNHYLLIVSVRGS